MLSMGLRLTFQQYFTARQFRVKFKAFTYFGALNPSVLAEDNIGSGQYRLCTGTVVKNWANFVYSYMYMYK